MNVNIIEGISTTGKTQLINKIKEINAHSDESKFSQFYFSEHLTERIFENSQNKINPCEHLYKILDFLHYLQETYKASNFYIRNKTIYSVYMERFAISNYVNGYIDKNELQNIFESMQENKLIKTNLILLKLSKENIIKSLKSSLKYRNDEWNKFITSNNGIEQFADKLFKQQEIYEKIAIEFSECYHLEIIEPDKYNFDYVQIAKHLLKKENNE
ncbi:MAG: hypothetical protein ACK5N8_09150 [Alphaproteobacteria bacterium]